MGGRDRGTGFSDQRDILLNSYAKNLCEAYPKLTKNSDEVLARITELEKSVDEGAFLAYGIRYYVSHQIDLLAMLRIIAFIEYVERNIKADSVNEHMQAAVWWGGWFGEWASEIEPGCELIMSLKQNRNQLKYFRELNRVVGGGIVPKARTNPAEATVGGRLEKLDRVFIMYLTKARENRNNKSPDETELMELAEHFAGPVLEAVDDILKIKENARKS